jgi:hypothetical protein
MYPEVIPLAELGPSLDLDAFELVCANAGALRGPTTEPLRTRVRRDRKPSSFDAALFLYVPFLVSAACAFSSTADDPLITLRYAANLVHGYGPVFNPGQHVQGFTSPLLLLVAVVAYVTPGAHALLVLKLSSLLFGLLAVREAGKLLYSTDIPLWAQRAGLLAVSSSWIVAYASGNGLETTLAMWLLVTLARMLVIGGPMRSPAVLALLAFGAVLARPDALLVVVAMSVAGLIIERPISWRWCAWISGAAVAVAGVVVVGLGYYGNVLPNTYYAKDMTLSRAVPLGAHYLVNSLEPGIVAQGFGLHAFSIGLLVIQLVAVLLGIFAVVRLFPRFGYLVAMLVAQLIFIVKSGGDWMVGGRFVAPVVIPLAVVELLGVVNLVSLLQTHRGVVLRRAVAFGGAGVLIVASAFPIVNYHSPVWQLSGVDNRSLLSRDNYSVTQFWTQMPHYLDCLRPGQLVATSEVGYLGFARQDLRLLDLRGLTSSAIARASPSSMKWPVGVWDQQLFEVTSPVGKILIRQRPALIVTFDEAPERTILSGEYRLERIIRFSDLSVGFYAPSLSLENCPAGA